MNATTAHTKSSRKPQHVAAATICAVLVFAVWRSRALFRANTLVVYVFSDTEAQYSRNLEFFLKEAVKADDGADYFIILQVTAVPISCHVLTKMAACSFHLLSNVSIHHTC
jgi:hypothetical protein